MVSLFLAASSGNPRGLYSGLHSFTWLMGLALCFWIGFWPWILLPVGVSIILGALYNPITAGLDNSGFVANQPPPQATSNRIKPVSKGINHQPPPSPEVPGAYQEGGQSYHYPPQPKQSDDQPPAQSGQQEEIASQQQSPA